MNNSQIEELRKLKTLLNEGNMTKEEFMEKRDFLLKGYSLDSRESTLYIPLAMSAVHGHFEQACRSL